MRVAISQDMPQVTDDGTVDVHGLADVGRIDVDVDFLDGGERGQLAGDAIIEARARRNQQRRTSASPCSWNIFRACRARQYA